MQETLTVTWFTYRSHKLLTSKGLYLDDYYKLHVTINVSCIKHSIMVFI